VERRGQGPTGNWLGKGPIESSMLSNGSDTIPSRVPVQYIEDSGQETWGKGECCSGFGERVCRFISEKSSMNEDPLEA